MNVFSHKKEERKKHVTCLLQFLQDHELAQGSRADSFCREKPLFLFYSFTMQLFTSYFILSSVVVTYPKDTIEILCTSWCASIMQLFSA